MIKNTVLRIDFSGYESQLFKKSMTKSENDFLKKIKVKKRKHQSLAARWLAKVVYTGVLDSKVHQQIKIKYDAFNNPILIDDQLQKNIRLSISHERNWVAISISDLPVGIDVMSFEEFTGITRIR